MHVARRLCVSLAKFERPLSTLNTFAKSEFSCSSSSSSSFRCMNTMSDWQMHNGVDLVKWLDTSVVNRQGRLFEPEKSLIPADKAIAFPPIECQCLLDGRDATVPSDSFGKTKLVVFSFRHYGFSLLRSWMDSFTAKIEPKLPKDAIDIIEVCFVEAGMFSLAKNMMSRSLRSKVESRRLNRTYVMFGGVMVRFPHPEYDLEKYS